MQYWQIFFTSIYTMDKCATQLMQTINRSITMKKYASMTTIYS